MQCPAYTGALLVKAESLYNCCEFEHALVLFYRGSRQAKTSQSFRNGIKKCSKNFENILADPYLFSFNGISIFLREVKIKVDQDKNFLDNYLAGREKIKLTGREKMKLTVFQLRKKEDIGFKIKHKAKKDIPQLLMKDQKYLIKLMNVMDKEQGKTSDMISEQANQALKFINERKPFWKQIEN